MSGANVAKKKKLKGWKKAAAIAGGAVLGAVNPFKIGKAVTTARKAYKASKYTKAAISAKKTTKVVKKVKAKPKQTVVAKKSTQEAFKKATAKKTAQTVKKQKKKVKAACFTAGTKIHTKDGFKNIEGIKVGDYVWSENPETKEKALKKVKKIFVREKDSIIRLSVNGEVIETTYEHPFYVEGKGFIAAGELKASDEVRLQSGEAGVVDYIEEVQLDKPINVYNFEVEDFHTYYVSEQKVLVHNTCGAKTVANTATIKKTASRQANDIVPYYPSNGGAVVGTEKTKYLMPGELIDRYGTNKGKYFSPINTPIDMRALPYDIDLTKYTQYEVLKPFPVEMSTIAPAFGKMGGGIQYRAPVSVEVLIKRRIIKEYGG